MKATFGSRLRKLRLQKELTQEQLGSVFNVTNVGVAKWESDDRFPSKEILIKIADYFDVSLDYLLGRTDYPKSKIFEGNVEGHNVRIDYDEDKYPDGLTYEQVIQVLKTFKAAGFSFSDKDDKDEK